MGCHGFVSRLLFFDGVFVSSLSSQGHGHSHHTGADHYSMPHGDLEEGEEKLQQNGEATSLAQTKVDASEGELMLSPGQTPQVAFWFL